MTSRHAKASKRYANSCTRSKSPSRRGGVLRPAQFNTVLGARQGQADAENLVNEVVLRTQAQAEYSAENYGHFGLALAPLRAFHLADPPLRRPDRASRADPRAQARRRRPARRRRHAPRWPKSPPASPPPSAARWSAERETIDRLIAHFLADRIGATFEGRISRRDARRAVREAQRDRRRRLHPRTHDRRRLFPVSTSTTTR